VAKGLGRIAGYELLEEVARGGMGVVYRARQTNLGRLVAVKVILAGRFASQDQVVRFQAEARAAAGLRHPNVVAIHEVGEADGFHYFSMDLIEGQTLAAVGRQQPVPPRRAADYVRALAEAVQFAHDHGVIHRDLKPSNVLVDAHDHVWITDFGLAKSLTHPSDRTLSGEPLGSPSFASPEQAAGRVREVGPASDLYALGGILYFLLSGRPPFLGESVADTLRLVMTAEPPALRWLNPAAATDLETICMKCLEKDPRRRYASVRLLAEDLGRFERGEPIRARPVGATGRMWRWSRRNPALACALGFAAATLLLGSTGVLWQWRRAEFHAANEYRQRMRAEHSVERMQFQKAEDLLAASDTAGGLAHLAHLVAANPTNAVAATRLVTALTARCFPWPVGQRLRHDGPLRMAVFSPNGGRVLTASDDGTARLWDSWTGVSLTPPLRHDDAVRCAVFDVAGQRVLTASHDGTARVWDSATGLQILPSMAHGSWVRRACFSPDNRRIATASRDGAGRIWDAATAQLLVTLQHADYVNAVVFSADGHWIATAADDHTARVWDATTGEPMTAPLRHDFFVLDVAFSPDAASIATAAHDRTARVWDVATGKERFRCSYGANVQTACFSPDGQRLLVAAWGGEAGLWNALSGRPFGQPFRHRSQLNLAVFSNDGSRLLTASEDATACVWDAAGVVYRWRASGSGADRRSLLEPMRHDGAVQWAAFSPDGQRVVTASSDHTAQVWDIRTSAGPSLVLRHEGLARYAVFGGDGATVATADADGGVVLWDAARGVRRAEILRHHSGVSALQFSPNGVRVASAAEDGSVLLWDAGTGGMLGLHHENRVRCLRFSPDGRRLLTCSDDRTARLWDVATGEALGPPLRHEGFLNGVLTGAFSPDGERVVTGGFNDNLVKIWEPRSGELLVSIQQRGSINRVAFSPDGQWVVSASEAGSARVTHARHATIRFPDLRHAGGVRDVVFSADGWKLATAAADHTARVWDATTGRALTGPLRHGAAVQSVRFGPDGRLLLTASIDGTARLWDAETGLQIAEPMRHGDEVAAAEFSPDGRLILTASSDCTARIWEVPDVASTAVPKWLPHLAEALAGTRLTSALDSEPVPVDRLLRLGLPRGNSPPAGPFERWAAWFTADRSSRSLAPGLSATTAEHVRRLVAEDRIETLSEALALAPDLALVPARLARRLCQLSSGPDSGEAARGDWLSRRALALAPDAVDSLWARAAWLAGRGSFGQALELMHTAAAQDPTEPGFWIDWSHWLQRSARLGEAERCIDRAVALATARLPAPAGAAPGRGALGSAETRDLRALACALQQRWMIRTATGRHAAAAEDQQLWLHSTRTPARDPRVTINQLDLTAFYNDCFVRLPLPLPPHGLHRLAETDFDARGAIAVANADFGVPARVAAIAVARRCRRLHFLHGVLSGPPPAGVRIGSCAIHYINGHTIDLPIIHEEAAAGAAARHSKGPAGLNDSVAGQAPAANEIGNVRVYLWSWDNPEPGVEIATVDLVSASEASAPALLAITVEP
jgi:WD40 repeat protein/predicted Ser/Thr protein kinase